MLFTSSYKEISSSSLSWSIKLTLIAILCILLNKPSLAQESMQEDVEQLRNPFESWFNIVKRKEAELKKDKPLNVSKGIEFALTGIMQGKRSLAIINGEVVSEGDIIEGKRVIQINKKTVLLEGGNEKITLEIKDEF